MAIDYSDPAQTTHNEQPIPINTPAKYAAGEAILKHLYTFAGVPWSETAASAYEQRVRQGQTLKQVIGNTYDEYLDRSGNTPGA